ncbi:glycosyltransferase family 1 protein [Peribacillus frigoritolerans]|uniref:glycosyltransferase family 1 protein n=1 Tax=Peribacillus frigoritolerans TaxID=450367 RepID=UPI00216270A8|nr:glycosyltransferase family 1 protein [Peribacillus frigoritolerans]
MVNDSIEPKRLLCIVSAMNVGGAETFLMKVYRALDRKKYQMDFYCMSKEKGYYEEEIISLGGKVFHSYPKSIQPIKSFLMLRKTVKAGKYEHVMRISQHSLATIDLIAAKLGGARTLIQRSSNANSGSRNSRILHFLFQCLPKIIPNIKIAPSTEAAEYTFGKNSVKNGKAIILKNAVNVDSLLFNQKKRDKIRKELNIENKFVIGHVGRFSNQKNHDFLINIFKEISKDRKNSVLVLVGKGELELEIKKQIELLNLKEKVIFTGIRSDIPDILMAMDIFIFPSLFEGMPNTVIEAQATGLPCLVSDSITKEAKITELVKYKSLNEGAKSWSEDALQFKRTLNCNDIQSCFIKYGYNIELVTREFEEIIFNN